MIPLAWLLVQACSAPTPPAAKAATLLYTHNVDGETEPCG